MTFDDILRSVDKYYGERIATYGPTANGVDWNSEESQLLRFEQLLRVCDLTEPFVINDYGCGYGSLLDFLTTKTSGFRYRGYDICQLMIEQARRLHGARPEAEFFTDEACLEAADYSIASGIFNVKQETESEHWHGYMLDTVQRLADLSRRGFAFNALTTYCDADRMRSDLFYADPLFWFDYCKRHISKRVSLLHDYPLYEFTILVTK